MAVPASAVLSQLKDAVQLMMDPLTPQPQRLEAYKACEEFKESSSECAQCGLVMAAKENSHIVRHFGLQLLEHSVRYKWNQMPADDKLFIKDNTLKLMAEGTYDLLTEETHIKDGLSRIMVEVIKREWPQQYPNMFDEFTELCKLGVTQTELVLLVFLRLAEDVLLFQTVPTQRRRDIMNGLSSNMANIYSFFINALKNNYQNYQQIKLSGDESRKSELLSYCKVAQAAIESLSAYVDWINVSYIFEENGMLLQMLCVMLSDDNLQLPAAECLLIITNRRGKLEDRKPLLVLFSEDAMTTILNAAILASQADLEEYHYLFLKKLCQVLTAIGTQLAAMWGVTLDGQEIGQPDTFPKYLDAILAFTQHPSQSLGSITQTLWGSFLRHEHISHNAIFKETYLPKIILTTRNSLLKVGFPSQDNSRSCDYSRLDFDSDEDFNVFYCRYRTEIAEMIRLATVICPIVTFSFAESWLNEQLQKQIDMGKSTDKDHCNLSSPSFLEWDAMTVFLECVLQKLHHSPSENKPPVENGIAMLKSVLQYSTEDPLLLSSQLSCISALFPFLCHAPDVLPVILDKIFAAAVFSLKGQTKSTRSRAVRNVRRHACSVLIKICKEYPHMLFPGFDQLYTYVKKLSSDPEELSQLEKTTLMEAIILISNEFKNFEKQVVFLGEILQDTKQMWFDPNLKEALWSSDKFMSYMGVDQAAVEPSSADTCGINRSHILFCANVIYGSMKRSTWPSDPDIARQGGFVFPGSENGSISYRNPATTHLLQMMENILALCRTLNQLWLDENQSKKHTDFAKAYELMDIEKDVILGIHPPCVDNTDATTSKKPLERMQSFITTVHDTCYHILGHAGQTLGNEFYHTNNLAVMLSNTVFTNLQTIPDFRLKVIIRAFLKPFAMNCPKEFHQSVLLPVLEAICPYILQRLTAKWQQISQDLENSKDDDEPETEQVLQEQILRQLSKEYMEYIGHLFKEKRSNATDGTQAADAIEDQQNDEVQNAAALHTREILIGDLGKLIISNDNVYPSLVMAVFNGLTWPDTSVCNKCISLCFPLLKQLVSQNKVTSDDICHVYKSILQSLQLQGQHEGQQSMLLTLGLQVYEHLRPKFSELKNVMLLIPSCTEHGIQVFDEKILNASPNKVIPEKRKKEMYKKLVQEIIGKNVGQQFKKECRIRNLPPLMKATKLKPAPLVDTETNDIGLCLLFVPDLEEM